MLQLCCNLVPPEEIMLHSGGCNMAIVIHCVSCKSNYKVGSKKCPKCGTSNRNNRKYRIMLRNPDGKQISRVVDNLELARELESKWRTEIVRGEQAITRKKAVLTLSDFWDKYSDPAIENAPAIPTTKPATAIIFVF